MYNFRAQARRPRRVVDVAATLEAIATLAEILTQHGPLHKDDITQQSCGTAASTIRTPHCSGTCSKWIVRHGNWSTIDGYGCRRARRTGVHPPGRCRRVNARRAHRDAGPRPDHRILRARAIPAARRRIDRPFVLAGYDDESLDVRDIPAEAIDPAGALLLMPGTLASARRGRGRHARSAVDPRGTRPRAGRRHRAADGGRAAGRDSRATNRPLSRRRPGPRVSRTPHCSPIRCRR